MIETGRIGRGWITHKAECGWEDEGGGEKFSRKEFRKFLTFIRDEQIRDKGDTSRVWFMNIVGFESGRRDRLRCWILKSQ